MRHFEEFEIENMLNSTGGVLFQLRCKFHLKRCHLCQKRMENVIEENRFAQNLKSGMERLISRGLQHHFMPDDLSR